MTFRQLPRWAAVIGILFLIAMTALALVTEDSLSGILSMEIFGALPLAIIWLTAQRRRTVSTIMEWRDGKLHALPKLSASLIWPENVELVEVDRPRIRRKTDKSRQYPDRQFQAS
jgi:hypothetical protein